MPWVYPTDLSRPALAWLETTISTCAGDCVCWAPQIQRSRPTPRPTAPPPSPSHSRSRPPPPPPGPCARLQPPATPTLRPSRSCIPSLCIGPSVLARPPVGAGAGAGGGESRLGAWGAAGMARARRLRQPLPLLQGLGPWLRHAHLAQKLLPRTCRPQAAPVAVRVRTRRKHKAQPLLLRVCVGSLDEL